MSTVSENGADSPGTLYTSFRTLRDAHEHLRNKIKDGEEPQSLLGEVEEFLKRGSMSGAYFDSLDDRMAAQGMLDYWVPLLFRSKRTPPDTTLAEFDPTTSPLLDDVKDCPYLGLNAFQEENAHLFYGRDRLVKLLLKRARTRRLIFVLGPSGSGKSSLVLAGLIPALKKEAEDEGTGERFFPRHVPGSNPLRNLSHALRAAYGESEEWAAEQARAMLKDHAHLAGLVAGRGGGRAVAVVDQFEEAFTLCLDDTLREAYIGNLTSLASASGARHLVILTMRSDYETYGVQVPALTRFFGDENLFRVTPLMADDLRQAIEEPARDKGLKFDDGIVDALVKDILGEPAGLPLLQFTLLRLWKTREGGRSRITWDSYRKLGSARRALALTADEFYNSLIDTKKLIVKRILLRMVRPSGVADTVSNRVKRSSLSFAQRASIDDALKALREAGLVRITPGPTRDNDQIEVAHEALVRNWPQLVDWVEKERVFMRQRLRLTAAADQWFEHGKDPGSLLAGKLLAEAQQYDTSELNDLEREYVQASADAEKAAEEERAEAAERERQLERDKMLALELKAAEEEKNVRLEREKVLALEQKAAEQAKNSRRLRIFVPILAALAVLALAAAVFAFNNEKKAHRSEQSARANETKAIEAAKRAEESTQTAVKAQADARREAENARTAAEAADSEKKRANDKAKELEVAIASEKKATREAKFNLDRFKALQAEVAGLAERHRKADAALLTDTNKAVEDYQYLLEYYHSKNDRRNEVAVHSSLAKAYRILSDRARDDSTVANNVKTYLMMARAESKAALMLFEQEIKQQESVPATEVPAVIPVLQERAEFYLLQEDSGEAEADYKRALELQEALLSLDNSKGKQTYDILVFLLSRLYRNQHENDKRIELYKRALGAKRRVYGDIAPDVYKMHRALANAYKDNRDYGKAEDQLKEALNIIDTVFGTNSPSSYHVWTLTELGDVYRYSKKYDDAEQVYKRVIKFAGEGVNAANAWLGLGALYSAQNRKPDEVEAAYLKAISLFNLDPEYYSEELTRARRTLLSFYFGKEEFGKAVPVLEELRKTASADLDKASFGRYSNQLGDTYIQLGQYDKAEQVYISLIAWVKENYINPLEANRLTFTYKDSLGTLYVKVGRIADAVAMYESSLKNAEAAYGEASEVPTDIRLRLAEAYEASGKLDNALAQYETAMKNLNIEESRAGELRFGYSHWIRAARTLEKYGEYLQRHNDAERGRRLIEKAKEIRKREDIPADSR